MAESKVTKLSLDFTPDDMRILNSLKKDMQVVQGRVSISAVIRAAIRKAAAK